MALAVHIAIAIACVVYSGYLLFAPSDNKFGVAYALVGSTILSGTYLVLEQPAQMARACVMGVLFVGASCAAIAAARRKLASENTKIDKTD